MTKEQNTVDFDGVAIGLSFLNIQVDEVEIGLRLANAVQRVQQRCVKRFVDLGPQAADMGFDNTGLGVKVDIPDRLKKHTARLHPTRSFHQML